MALFDRYLCRHLTLTSPIHELCIPQTYYCFRSLIDSLASISILIMDLYVDRFLGFRLTKRGRPRDFVL